MALQVIVISPVRTLFEGEAVSVTLPGSQGEFQVLKDHVNLISSLDAGLITIQSADGTENMVTDGGFVEVKDNVVSALIERAYERDEIDAEKDKLALEDVVLLIGLHN